mmetsp:Transcript_13462/g.23957  ORF Transcript_13462/g.23957 Transcript_13462/m.23957 type:complete len:369 (+) Transcript_13462:1303-2409(+)
MACSQRVKRSQPLGVSEASRTWASSTVIITSMVSFRFPSLWMACQKPWVGELPLKSLWPRVSFCASPSSWKYVASLENECSATKVCSEDADRGRPRRRSRKSKATSAGITLASKRASLATGELDKSAQAAAASMAGDSDLSEPRCSGGVSRLTNLGTVSRIVGEAQSANPGESPHNVAMVDTACPCTRGGPSFNRAMEESMSALTTSCSQRFSLSLATARRTSRDNSASSRFPDFIKRSRESVAPASEVILGPLLGSCESESKHLSANTGNGSGRCSAICKSFEGAPSSTIAMRHRRDDSASAKSVVSPAETASDSFSERRPIKGNTAPASNTVSQCFSSLARFEIIWPMSASSAGAESSARRISMSC